MKTVLSAILPAGIACALPVTVSSVAFAGGYGYGGGGGSYAPTYHPKAYYPPNAYAPPPAYSGDYPPQGCTGDQTYNPPSGYADGCAPPPDWVSYCQARSKSFDADNGYSVGYDHYYHYCS